MNAYKTLAYIFMQEEKQTHGGKRVGAGRKPMPAPPKVIAVRLTEDERAYLQTLDTSPSKAIRQLIKQARGG